MKISDDFKAIAYKTANQVIEKFRNKELKDKNEEQIVIEATMIKVGIDKIPSIIDKQTQSRKNRGIEITEDFILFMICKNNHLFNRTNERFNLEELEELSVEAIIADWKNTKNEFDGVEKYFNTKDEHFNNNAYYWHLHLRDSNLFPEIELPFEILSEYLYFLDNFRTPITCVEKLKKKMDEYNLTKEQKIFIYDKINGLIANADTGTQNNLAHINIEVLDSRWSLEPYQDLNIEKYSIEFIAEEALKIDDLYERLKFLKHRKIEYEREAENIGWDIGLSDEIQVEIEVLEKRMNDNKFNTKPAGAIENILTNVQEFIKKGYTIEAINYLIDNRLSENESVKRDIYLLSGQWEELERKINLGLINDADAGLTRNRISNAILKITNEFGK
ncbi:hypothetical protein [Haliscomenobacter sp.]|uniref:hypothetical protein n=1 Tax=Haliscomenobacter sp. TaxID=2717303 RepID=UPI0035947D1C